VGKIDDYSGETVQYNHERRKDSFAEVQTTIETNTDKISLDYRLILKDGKWGVYDVVVDGVSLVRNYRSQFDRIIRRSSYNELVKTMQERKGEIAAP
jgi:phospholipid transport system substrate-binding protein